MEGVDDADTFYFQLAGIIERIFAIYLYNDLISTINNLRNFFIFHFLFL